MTALRYNKLIDLVNIAFFTINIGSADVLILLNIVNNYAELRNIPVPCLEIFCLKALLWYIIFIVKSGPVSVKYKF